jgi:hypothetical protein
MLASVRALLSGIVDYAGLFPPAQLPLDQAVRNYLRYRISTDSWLLGRFICPAARLSELVAFRHEIDALPAPLVVSALGRGGKDSAEFLAGVRSDLADIARLRESFGEKAAVDVYEVKLPPALFDPAEKNKLFALVGTTAFLLEKEGPGEITPFMEPPSARRDVVELAVATLAADHAAPEASSRRRCRPAGLKIRCGGADSAAIPTPEQLAFAITHACENGIALKFTAGLHQPLRHFDAALNAHAHGFLNLFVAGTLAYAHGMTKEAAEKAIANENVDRFHFDEFGLDWKKLIAVSSQVEMARRTAVTSFGSCSFDEPCEGLRALGLIH